MRLSFLIANVMKLREGAMAIQVTSDLQENIKNFEELFSDCADIKKRNIRVGQQLDAVRKIQNIKILRIPNPKAGCRQIADLRIHLVLLFLAASAAAGQQQYCRQNQRKPEKFQFFHIYFPQYKNFC